VGSAGGDERDAVLLEDRRSRHREGRIAVPDTGDHVLRHSLLRTLGGFLLVSLSVDADQLDLTSEQAAVLVDLLNPQLSTAVSRRVDRGHAAGQIVECGNLNRVFGVNRRGCC
jgi:hypothetical protein